jgi:hypothetical protein
MRAGVSATGKRARRGTHERKRAARGSFISTSLFFYVYEV